MPRARKRLHGKRRMRSALKQRMSDVSSNDNPYASSGNVQFGPELKANIDKFNKDYKYDPEKVNRINKEVAQKSKEKEDKRKGREFLQEKGVDSLKKKVIKEGTKRLGIGGTLKGVGSKLAGVAGLMLDALPAGEGSTVYTYKRNPETGLSETFYNHGPNKGKKVQYDENFQMDHDYYNKKE